MENKMIALIIMLISLLSIISIASASDNVKTNLNTNKPGGIALVWDDTSNIDSTYNYLSMFQKYGATCTMSANIEGTDTQKDELNALHSAGWEIACHGSNHLDPIEFLNDNTPTEWLNQEIFPNIEQVSSYNSPVYSFVYPYSSRDETTDAILAPYFRTLRTKAPWVVHGNVNETTLAYYKWDDAQLLYGVEIDDQDGCSLQSIEYGIDHAIETGTVLVLYGHHITPTVTGPYQTSTSRLDSILSYTSDHGGVFYHMGDLGNSSWVPPQEYSV